MTPTHLYGADSLTPAWSPDWRTRAACRGVDTDLFYPPHGTRGHALWDMENEAKAICDRCPVKAECLEAGRRERHGVWGGTTPAERGYDARTKHRTTAAVPA